MSGNISDPSTWAPPGETSQDLWLERSNFVGVVLSSVAYGVHLTLYLFVLHHLIAHPSTRSSSPPIHHNNHHHGNNNYYAAAVRQSRRISWPLVLYITWNFVLGTFGIAAEAKFNELTFVDARNFPGGPNAFVNSEYGDFVNMFGTVAYVILQWSADALVIYRFWLIYNFNYWIALFPCLMLLGSFCMGVLLLFQLTQPSANLWTKTTLNFGIPYWSISASLNILVTSLIVLRLLLIRARTRAVLSKSHSRTYTSIAAMLVESAFLYSATALIFIITYARGGAGSSTGNGSGVASLGVQNLVLPVLGQVQAVSPLLIMWRVARGQAICREAMLTSEGDMSPSKISWRRSVIYSNGTVSTTATTATTTGGGGGVGTQTMQSTATSGTTGTGGTSRTGGSSKRKMRWGIGMGMGMSMGIGIGKGKKMRRKYSFSDVSGKAGQLDTTFSTFSVQSSLAGDGVAHIGGNGNGIGGGGGEGGKKFGAGVGTRENIQLELQHQTSSSSSGLRMRGISGDSRDDRSDDKDSWMGAFGGGGGGGGEEGGEWEMMDVVTKKKNRFGNEYEDYEEEEEDEDEKEGVDVLHSPITISHTQTQHSPYIFTSPHAPFAPPALHNDNIFTSPPLTYPNTIPNTNVNSNSNAHSASPMNNSPFSVPVPVPVPPLSPISPATLSPTIKVRETVDSRDRDRGLVVSIERNGSVGSATGGVVGRTAAVRPVEIVVEREVDVEVDDGVFFGDGRGGARTGAGNGTGRLKPRTLGGRTVVVPTSVNGPIHGTGLGTGSAV